jgi:hypothetical protein
MIMKIDENPTGQAILLCRVFFPSTAKLNRNEKAAPRNRNLSDNDRRNFCGVIVV